MSVSDTGSIDVDRLPRHIAIIMDGNGRWAKQRGLPRVAGHEAGARAVRAAVEACRKLGVSVLSLYAFSTENWRRSRYEVNALFRLLGRFVRQEIDNIHEQGIRVVVMGRREGLPPRVLADLDHCVQKTAANTAMVLNVAINYGARAEIVDAAKAIVASVRAGTLAVDEIDESHFGQFLYRAELPDPDLLIRTSGEFRLSNFMLWQLSYAEIVVLPVLWPDFSAEYLHKAIAEYQSRQRRFGGA